MSVRNSEKIRKEAVQDRDSNLKCTTRGKSLPFHDLGVQFEFLPERRGATAFRPGRNRLRKDARQVATDEVNKLFAPTARRQIHQVHPCRVGMVNRNALAGEQGCAERAREGDMRAIAPRHAKSTEGLANQMHGETLVSARPRERGQGHRAASRLLELRAFLAGRCVKPGRACPCEAPIELSHKRSRGIQSFEGGDSFFAQVHRRVLLAASRHSDNVGEVSKVREPLHLFPYGLYDFSPFVMND